MSQDIVRLIQGKLDTDISLEMALQQLETCTCSERRDYICAAMSIVKEEQKLPIDYSVPPRKLWWLVVQEIVLKSTISQVQGGKVYAPLPHLRQLLYSPLVAELGVDNEFYRDLIRAFILDFWKSWAQDRSLTLERYVETHQDPYDKWSLERNGLFLHVYHSRIYPFRRMVADVFVERDESYTISLLRREPWFGVLIGIQAIFTCWGAILENHSWSIFKILMCLPALLYMAGNHLGCQDSPYSSTLYGVFFGLSSLISGLDVD